jgi:hypothetical protein
MQHFGCQDWACVEGFFQEGGAYAGLWGWLEILMRAEDGYSVGVLLGSQSGHQLRVSGRFATITGQIVVHLGQMESYTPGQNHSLLSMDGTVGEQVFSSLIFMAPGGEPAVAGGYSLPDGGIGLIGPSTRKIDCRHTDCTGRVLNAVATTSAIVGAGCTYTGQLHCVAGARAVGFSAGAIATWRTATRSVDNLMLGNATAIDFVDTGVTVVTTSAGLVSHPYAGPAISAGQWMYDEYVSPRLR